MLCQDEKKADVSAKSGLPAVEPILPVNPFINLPPGYSGEPLQEPIPHYPLERVHLPTTCLFPFLVTVPKSPYFPDGKRWVPCGHCLDCLTRKRNELYLRFIIEARNYPLNYFVTLTYDDEHIYFSDNGRPAVCNNIYKTSLSGSASVSLRIKSGITIYLNMEAKHFGRITISYSSDGLPTEIVTTISFMPGQNVKISQSQLSLPKECFMSLDITLTKD